MLEGLTLQPNHVARLNRMLAAWERSGHNRLPATAPRSARLPFEMRRFELYDDLTPSGDGTATSAQAVLLYWDDDAEDYAADYDEEKVDKFDVWDLSGTSTGHGYDPDTETPGTRGIVWHPHDVDRWEILGPAADATVPCANVGTEVAPPHAVMAVVGVAADGKTLTVQKPNNTFYRVYAINGGSELPIDGSIGRCYMPGPEPVEALTDGSATPAHDQGWGPKPGQWSLSINYPCVADCLGVADDDAGTMLIVLHPMTVLIGKIYDALSAGGTGLFNAYHSQTTPAYVTGWQVTACDWMLPSGGSIPSNTKLGVSTWINGRWYLTGAQC
jgi:hypothetical protein